MSEAAAFFMPTTQRPKIRRKDLKQPDEFMTVAYSVQEFVEQHLNKVISGVLAAAVLAVILFLTYQHMTNVRHEAAQQFYDAFSTLDAKDYKGAEQKFQALIADHPSTSVGRLARFYLGLAYFDSGDLKNARQALEEYTQGEGPPSIHSLALMDLGVVYEQTGDYAKAVDTYGRVAALNGPDSNNAHVAVARVLQLEGKRDAAISAYQDFLKANPYAPQREVVLQALANLGVSAPSPGDVAPGAP
jgi:predicted negative regulator of RcsB-dependent stress response